MVLSAMTGSIGGELNVNYIAPKDTVLVNGKAFNTALKLPGGASNHAVQDTTIKSITFDYYSNVDSQIIHSASSVLDVSSSGGTAVMYHIGDSTNGYDVYVLCEKKIIANSLASHMFYYCTAVHAYKEGHKRCPFPLWSRVFAADFVRCIPCRRARPDAWR